MSDTAILVLIAVATAAAGSYSAFRVWTGRYAGKTGGPPTWWAGSPSLWEPWARTTFVMFAVGMNALALIVGATAFRVWRLFDLGVATLVVCGVLIVTTYVWGKPRFLVAPPFRSDARVAFPDVESSQSWIRENRFGLVAAPVCILVVLGVAILADAVGRATVLGGSVILYLVVWWVRERWRARCDQTDTS